MRKGPNVDPDRTRAMADVEQQLWDEFLTEISERQAHDEQWRENWLKSLRRQLNNCADYAGQQVARSPETLHEQRRLVAVYHQFYDLLSQGYPHLRQASAELCLLVFGRWYVIRLPRVHCTEQL